MAAITAAVIGAAGAIGGAAMASKGAKSAAKTQAKGAESATAEQRRQYDLSRGDQMPWLDAGKGALSQMQKLNAGDYSSFNASPDYQWTLSEGMKGLDRSAASKGRLYSGGYGEDLTRFGQGLASQQYGNYYNRLAAMAGVGQTTASGLGVLGANMANNIGNNMQNAADARASGYANSANAWGNAAGQLGQIGANYFGSKAPSYSAPSSQYSASQPANWYSGVGSTSWNSQYGGG